LVGKGSRDLLGKFWDTLHITDIVFKRRCKLLIFFTVIVNKTSYINSSLCEVTKVGLTKPISLLQATASS